MIDQYRTRDAFLRVRKSLEKIQTAVEIASLRLPVQLCKEHYQATENPFFAWEGYRRCIENDIALPKWINDYMREVAAKVVDLDYQAENKNFNECIAKALNVTGAKEYAQYLERDKKMRIGWAVHEAMREETHESGLQPKKYLIYSDIAKQYQCGETVVRECYLEFRDLAERTDYCWD